MLAEAQVDPLPVFRHRTPLQKAVQLLKRHRDVHFMEAPDLKPVSIILTTVAGEAYVPGESVDRTIERTLDALNAIRLSNTDDVRNPINPKENFADRWTKPGCVQLGLKQQFHQWITAATQDFSALRHANMKQLIEVAHDRFMVRIDEDTARDAATRETSSTPVRRVAVGSQPPSPWCR
jgi:hypothetical protein